MGPGAGGTETIRRMWPDVMGRLGGIKRTTWSLVSHYAQVLDYDGSRLLLQFDSPGRAASFGKGAHQEFLRQAMIDVMGIDCRFEATAGDAPPAAASHAVAAPPQEAAPAPAPAAPAARAAQRPAPAEPRDDIPLPPEPPPDDLPPEPDRPVRAASVTLPASSSPPRVVRLADDVPSVDDPDLEGADLVGASVVEQLLGGRVIEDRKD
jgi:DNA polymerase-3 subunit gamma/tau